MKKGTGSERLILVGVLLLLQLPFLTQPFHIDDRVYLEIAENAMERPLAPYDFAPAFEGLVTPDSASHSHLPLTSYYLALVIWVTGVKIEWVLHLSFLVFPLLAGLAFYDLAGRFTRFRLAAALLLTLSPAFLVLSHTLMTEVPLLAFWLLAISRFVPILEGGGKPRDWILLGVGLVASAFISLLSGGLILLLAALIAVAPWVGVRLSPSVRLRLLAVLGLPLLLWGLWYLRGHFYYDRFLLLWTLQHMEKREAFTGGLLAFKAFSALLNLGGAFACPIALWYGFGRKWSIAFLPFLILAPAGTALLWPQEEWSGAQIFLLVLFLSMGIIAAVGLAGEVRFRLRRERGERRLWWAMVLFWTLGIALSAVVLYPSGAVRYCLLLAPPLILGWFAVLQRKLADNSYFLRNLVWLGVILTGLYGLPVAAADTAFARMYQQSARQLVSDYRAEGRQVWFTAEWGFRHYLEEAGARLLLRTSAEPQAGDVVIKPYIASPWVTLVDGSKYSRLLEQREASVETPIRMIDYSSHAGFYSTAWGVLPFSWSSGGKWEWFNVFEVTQAYDGPIPEPERHW